MAVTNESPSVITDVTLDFLYDDKLLNISRHEPEYPFKNGKFILGNIDAGKSKSIAIYFDPLMCSKGTDINCHITYKDHQGNLEISRMEPKEISVICPIMKTESDINIGRLKEFIANLPTKDSRVYEIKIGFNVEKLTSLAREVIEKHDVRHVRTLHTRDEKTTEVWYYGTTKVTKDAIVIKISIFKEQYTMELFAATRNSETLTGLLAEVGRDLKEAVESKTSGKGGVINVTIKDSIVQRSNLLDMCDIDGSCDVNVVIEGSVVQRTNIATVDKEEQRLKKTRKEDLSGKGTKSIPSKLESISNPSNKSSYYTPPSFTSPKENNESPYETKSNNRLLLFLLLLLIVPLFFLFISPSEVPIANYDTYTNSIGMEFVLIHEGEFTMGTAYEERDTFSSEIPAHEVTIENAFYLGKYEVTQEQWFDVMGSNPSQFEGNNKPVESVSWDDVQVFVKKLNEMEQTDKYRLPSEAEWEYACRAGTNTRYFFGDDKSQMNEYAWYYDWLIFVGDGTKSVGQKNPNPWGLYDMYGNVEEWTQDRYYFGYEGAPIDGSAWVSGGGYDSGRVHRGGSWGSLRSDCYSAVRSNKNPDYTSNVIGFRLAMDV